MRLAPDPLAVVDRFLAEIDARAPGLVEGLHLHGSLGFGEYHPGHSDVDFVAVLSRRAGAGDLERLALHPDHLRADLPALLAM
jgi:hypothetical protein